MGYLGKARGIRVCLKSMECGFMDVGAVGVCVGCVGWNVCMSEELEVRIRIESQGLDKVWGYRARFRFRIKA